ncbi:hypothetical protein T492DRAFT_873610 [Pavlovales sp. CCMP2436]|nr:hypothetical protein T492DRAFT_873610 [Pavlovales sp. CCMP2436]
MATLTQGLYVLLDRNNEWKGNSTPRFAKAMRGSLGLRGHQLRGQKLLGWFDGLLLGEDPHLLKDPAAEALAPPPGCGKLLCFIDCWVSILGLGEGAVHPDDLLLALLVISNMVPADRVGECPLA